MLNGDVLNKLPADFDLNQATKRAVENAVSRMLAPDKKAAIISSIDLNGTLHLGVAIRAGNHTEIYGEIEGHFKSKDFSGQVSVTSSW